MGWFFFILFCSSLLFSQQPLPLIIAHRGASADAPENTIAAFKEAMRQHADAIEIDVRMTADSQLVVMHDSNVQRTTNGSGAVADFTLEELRTLDAGSWFSAIFSGERTPTLKNVLLILDSTTLLIIEIKSESEGIEQRVIGEVNDCGKRKQVLLKSFYPGAIRKFQQLAPDIPRIYVFAFHLTFFNFTFGTTPRFENIFETPAEYLQIHRLAVTRSFAEKAHRNKFKVIVWDVNGDEDMKEMIALGVDGIETDHPAMLNNLYNIFNRNASEGQK